MKRRHKLPHKFEYLAPNYTSEIMSDSYMSTCKSENIGWGSSNAGTIEPNRPALAYDDGPKIPLFGVVDNYGHQAQTTYSLKQLHDMRQEAQAYEHQYNYDSHKHVFGHQDHGGN